MDSFGLTFLTTFMMTGPAGQQNPQSGGLEMFLPMIVIIAIFYFLLIRPQMKKQKEHQKMVDDLKRGDRIITTGGVYGTIVGIDDKTIQLKIADKVKIQIMRSAIHGKAGEESEIGSVN